MSNYPSLSHAQIERLAFLSEECGEVVQAIGKILRHGYDSYNPTVMDGPCNKEALEDELGHIQTAIRMLEQSGDINARQITKSAIRKIGTVEKWLHHQGLPNV